MYVKPYEHLFNCYVKVRWENKQILEMFSNEYLAYSREYYQKAIEEGKITVNKKKVEIKYQLKMNDIIQH